MKKCSVLMKQFHPKDANKLNPCLLLLAKCVYNGNFSRKTP